MKIRFSSASILLQSVAVVLSASVVASAQSAKDSMDLRDPARHRWGIVPTASISWNNHAGSFRVPGNPDCPAFDHGSAFGFGIGLSAEFFPDKAGSWSISPGVLYEERPAKFDDIVAGAAGNTGRISEITYALLSTEIMYKHEIVRSGNVGIGLKFGPTAQYVLKGTVRQVNLTDSGTMVCFDGDIPERNSLRFAVKGGVEADVDLGKQWMVVPGVYYEHGLTGVLVSGRDWKVHSLSFQMGLLIPMW